MGYSLIKRASAPKVQNGQSRIAAVQGRTLQAGEYGDYGSVGKVRFASSGQMCGTPRDHQTSR